jgi:hypothetical protein
MSDYNNYNRRMQETDNRLLDQIWDAISPLKGAKQSSRDDYIRQSGRHYESCTHRRGVAGDRCVHNKQPTPPKAATPPKTAAPPKTATAPKTATPPETAAPPPGQNEEPTPLTTKETEPTEKELKEKELKEKELKEKEPEKYGQGYLETYTQFCEKWKIQGSAGYTKWKHEMTNQIELKIKEIKRLEIEEEECNNNLFKKVEEEEKLEKLEEKFEKLEEKFEKLEEKFEEEYINNLFKEIEEEEKLEKHEEEKSEEEYIKNFIKKMKHEEEELEEVEEKEEPTMESLTELAIHKADLKDGQTDKGEKDWEVLNTGARSPTLSVSGDEWVSVPHEEPVTGCTDT